MKRDVGAFNVCGSYYPTPCYADELWNPYYLTACEELDSEFPEALLLPARGISIGLSPHMIEVTRQRMKIEELSEQLRRGALP